MKRGIIAVFLIVSVASGCAHPELTRRYHTKTFTAKPAYDYVTVSAFTMNSPDEKRQSLVASLSGEGQAAFIGEIGKRTGKSLGELIKVLGDTGAEDKETLIDKTVFHKRIVFGVTKKEPGSNKDDLTLADRLNFLKVTLSFENRPEYQGVFQSWSIFETKYQFVDLGRINRTQSVSAELAGSIGPAAQGRIPAQIGATLRGEKKIEEEVKLRKQYIQLAGILSPNKKKAELYQEGAMDIDLAGTFMVDFVVRADPKNVNSTPETVVILGPLEKAGKPVKPEDVQLDFANIKYVKDRKDKDPKTGESKRVLDPIKCRLSYDYLLRHVVACDREIAEGYHKVEFWKGSVPTPIIGQTQEIGPDEGITLVGAGELKARVFAVALGKGPILNIELPFAAKENHAPLQFATYESARDFLTWIKENKKYTTIAKYDLCYDFQGKKRYLRKDEIPMLNVEPIDLN